MSIPDIAIHKRYPAREAARNSLCKVHSKRLQKVFKITNSSKIERGGISILEVWRKYRIPSRSTIGGELQKLGTLTGKSNTIE